MLEIIVMIIGGIILISIIGALLETCLPYLLTAAFIILEIGLIVTGRARLAIIILAVVVILGLIAAIYEGLSKLVKETKRKQELRKNKKKISDWTEAGRYVAVDIDQVMCRAVDQIKQHYTDYYDYINMPCGRAVAFATNFSGYCEDDEYYFFVPEKTHDPFEIRENGLLVAKSGIYRICEKVDSNKEYQTYKYQIRFCDCFAYDEEKKVFQSINKSRDGFDPISLSAFSVENAEGNYISSILYTVIQNKIPQQLTYYGLSYSEKEIIAINNDKSFKKISSVSALIASESARNSTYQELKNYMNGSRGGGYAAEYANNTIDRISGKRVINEAQNLDSTGRQVKDGADRIVNGVPIQTKYHKDFSSFCEDTFPEGNVRYKVNEDPMQIEVPKDKYYDFCDKLQTKIDSGDVKVPDGTKASDILKRGHVTWDQAQNVAKAGTIESITIDTLEGLRCTLPYATVSSVVVFAVAIWNGKDVKVAFKGAGGVFLKTWGLGTFSYFLTAQMSSAQMNLPLLKAVDNPIWPICQDITKEIKTSQLAETEFGKQLGLDKITEKQLVGATVTAVIIVGPDIYKFFSGKISGQQLFKNLSVAGGSMGGTAIGEFVAETSGIIGGPAGRIIGGIIGGFVAKAVLDKFIEDDAVKMFRIFKEEYLDIITLSGLNSSEFEKVANLTLMNEELTNILGLMYSREEPRQFARSYINGCVVEVIKERTQITNAMVLQGMVSYCGEQLTSLAN